MDIVLIRRKDGRTFAFISEQISASPLDISYVNINITTKNIVDIIRNERER